MRKRCVFMLLALLGTSAAGCSTYINDTAPAKTPNSVYAVGAKQGFLTVDSKVWVCPAVPASSTDCRPVDVVIQ